MQVDLAAPASLGLALIQLDGQPGRLGIALRHPPVHLLARPAPGLVVTGARADLAQAQALRFFAHHGLPPRGELEIELAIPFAMGLGSDALLGLSVAGALAALHGLPVSDVAGLARAVGLGAEAALEEQAFGGGGLLALDATGQPQRRLALSHSAEPDDWVFVLVLPRVPPGTPADHEAAHQQTLAAAASRLDPAAERIFAAELWPAAERDDIATFAAALMLLQALNDRALAAAGHPQQLSAAEQATLAVLREGGALAYGRAPAGLALYGLIRGGGPSRDLRQALSRQLGRYGGTVMATICDPGGSRYKGAPA